MKSLLNRIAPLVLGVFISTAAQAHESPIDHVERDLQLWVKDGQLYLSYRQQFTDRAALMQLKQMDGNADGKVSDAERDAFFAAEAAAVAKQFTLTVDDKPLQLSPTGQTKCDAQLGQTVIFAAPLPALAPGKHPGLLIDGHSREYPGAFHWKKPGEGKPTGVKVVPLTQPEDPRTLQHPAWLELKFEIVVPE